MSEILSGADPAGQAPAPDELLTVEEVASLLKVPHSWVYLHTRKRGAERMPHVKLGKYLRFFESEVRKFLEQKTRRYGS